MVGTRVSMHRLQEFVRLCRMGKSSREVCRMLRMGRTAAWRYRKAFVEAGLLVGAVDELPSLEHLSELLRRLDASNSARYQASSVERWRSDIQEKLKGGAGPRAIYDWLRTTQSDFQASESSVKRFVTRLQRESGPLAKEIAIAVETGPGEVAQVDFGYIGKVRDPRSGKLRKAWVFVMTLCYSRRCFACIVFDQRIETWIECHVRAIYYFGGVPKVVVPDNLKAAVVRCAFGAREEAALQRSYVELARHYGFLVDPAPPRSPEKKGKVEASVKYVKRNFFAVRRLAESDIDDLQRELETWLREVADQRIHGTTKTKPIELFESQEAGALLPLPTKRYELCIWKPALVHRDFHVSFEKRLYSVPFQLCGEHVWIRASAHSLEIYHAEKRVATHERRGVGHRSTTAAHLPEYRGAWRERSPEYWKEEARAIGEDVLRLVEAIFDAEDALSKLRTVQSIVTSAKRFPVERANAASRRALHFGNLSYGGWKSILEKGLDQESISEADTKRYGVLGSPRFARRPIDPLISHRKEYIS